MLKVRRRTGVSAFLKVRDMPGVYVALDLLLHTKNRQAAWERKQEMPAENERVSWLQGLHSLKSRVLVCILALSGQADMEGFTSCRMGAVVTGSGLISKHSIEIYSHGGGGLLQWLTLQSWGMQLNMTDEGCYCAGEVGWQRSWSWFIFIFISFSPRILMLNGTQPPPATIILRNTSIIVLWIFL